MRLAKWRSKDDSFFMDKINYKQILTIPEYSFLKCPYFFAILKIVAEIKTANEKSE